MAQPESPEQPPCRLSETEVATCLDAMAGALARQLDAEPDPLSLVGVQTGGVRIAEALRERLPAALRARLSSGALDANFYRDDYAQRGLHASKPSRMPLSLDGHTVVLVDDVLHTGRTARAALNALFDRGRPRRVLLAVLIERPERELPIGADIVGVRLEVDAGRKLALDANRLAVVETAA